MKMTPHFEDELHCRHFLYDLFKEHLLKTLKTCLPLNWKVWPQLSSLSLPLVCAHCSVTMAFWMMEWAGMLIYGICVLLSTNSLTSGCTKFLRRQCSYPAFLAIYLLEWLLVPLKAPSRVFTPHLKPIFIYQLNSSPQDVGVRYIVLVLCYL